MQVGIDIQDVEPVKRVIGTERMKRMFSKRELDYIDMKNCAPQTVAGMFCAKEAFFKALGKGINIQQLVSVEIHHDQLGAPSYQLSSDIIAQNRLSTAKITLSISHTKSVAVAVCIISRINQLI